MTAAEVPAVEFDEPLNSSAAYERITRRPLPRRRFAPSTFASHHQALDVMFLRYGHEVIDNSANQVVAQLRW